MPSSRMTNSKGRSTGPHTNATQHRRSQTNQMSMCRCVVIDTVAVCKCLAQFGGTLSFLLFPVVLLQQTCRCCVVNPLDSARCAVQRRRISRLIRLAIRAQTKAGRRSWLPAVPSCCSSLRASLIRTRCSCCCCVGTRPARRGEAQRAEGSFGAESHRRFVQLLCCHDAHGSMHGVTLHSCQPETHHRTSTPPDSTARLDSSASAR